MNSKPSKRTPSRPVVRVREILGNFPPSSKLQKKSSLIPRVPGSPGVGTAWMLLTRPPFHIRPACYRIIAVPRNSCSKIFVTVVSLCALVENLASRVDEPRSAAYATPYIKPGFSQLQRGSLFLGALEIRNSLSFVVISNASAVINSAIKLVFDFLLV